MCGYVQTHQIVYIKYIKLSFNKTVKKKTQKSYAIKLENLDQIEKLLLENNLEKSTHDEM